MKKIFYQIGTVLLNVCAFSGLAFLLSLSLGFFEMGWIGGYLACTIVLFGMAFGADDETLRAFKTILHME